MQYLLLIYENESQLARPVSEADQGKIFRRVHGSTRGASRDGNYIGGAALQPIAHRDHRARAATARP